MQSILPLISVIIPVYNVAEYLPKCMESVTGQTYKNLEIILINDGSADNSGEICDIFAKKDNRIRVIHQENAGVSVARNAGLDIAKGEWIGFVDPDDWVETNIFERLCSTATESGLEIAMCGYTMHDTNGQTSKRISTSSAVMLNNQYALERILYDRYTMGYVYVWNKLFSRQIIGDTRFNTSFYAAQDAMFTLDIFLKNPDAVYIPEPLYNYCKREGSTSKSFNVRRLSELDAWRYAVKRTSSKALCNLAKVQYTCVAMGLMFYSLKFDALRHFPMLKKEARTFAFTFFLSSYVSLKMKLRTFAVLLFPKTVYALWQITKTYRGKNK